MRTALVSAALLLGTALAGCLGLGDEGLDASSAALVDLAVLPVEDDWYSAQGVPNTHYHAAAQGEAPFHTLEEIEAKLLGWQEAYPDLVSVEVIGESIEGRPLYDVIVTNQNVPGPKLAPILDGGHHANELGGIEIMLFTVDFLLQNHERNATVREIVDTLEVHVVPLVNPDGYVVQTRGNALGVNLNRNYDVDWGNPGGASNFVMGTLAHATGEPMPSIPVVAENCGPGPFSEPESQAMRDLFERLKDRTAFYLTGHTPTHAVIAPWAAFEPPFPVPEEHHAVLEAELSWIRENTEYEAGKAAWGNLSAGLPYSASGSSMDYYYVTTGKPAFTLEVEFWYSSATSEGFPARALAPYEGLRYWMDATLPIPIHMLENAARLSAWELPTETTIVPGAWSPDLPDRSGHPHPPIAVH